MPTATRSVLALLLTLTAVAGCVVDATLDPAGGGRLRLHYRLVSVADFEQTKGRLQSADVTLTDASMTPEKWATFDLTFRDARKLSTVPAFERTTVTLTDESGGLRTLTVTVAGDRLTLPAPYVDYLGREFRLGITLPGDVVRSNATSVDARTVTWVRPIVEMQQQSSHVFTATFRPTPTTS